MNGAEDDEPVDPADELIFYGLGGCNEVCGPYNGKKFPRTLPARSSTCSHFLAGIADFIDAALDKDVAIGLVAGTCSIAEEQIMTLCCAGLLKPPQKYPPVGSSC